MVLRGGGTEPLTITLADPLPVDIDAQTFTPLEIDIIAQSFSPLKVDDVSVLGKPVGTTIGNLTNSAYTSPNDIFVADLTPTGTTVGDSVIFRILWSAIDGGLLSFTLNGSDFVFFNDQNALKEDSVHLFDVIVDNGDSFNLQFEKDTTITFLRVVQLI